MKKKLFFSTGQPAVIFSPNFPLRRGIKYIDKIGVFPPVQFISTRSDDFSSAQGELTFQSRDLKCTDHHCLLTLISFLCLEFFSLLERLSRQSFVQALYRMKSPASISLSPTCEHFNLVPRVSQTLGTRW